MCSGQKARSGQKVCSGQKVGTRSGGRHHLSPPHVSCGRRRPL
ncbi:hypothetical protein A33M_3270 [Rhodovulum sp. PH10]|nr:hypothetical protein A33M_3270 [Rhodovulum sp. PH10]